MTLTLRNSVCYNCNGKEAIVFLKTVNEVCKIFGVSPRTLHYYDEIGLLSPSAVTAAGYRLYDGEAIARLQSILLFRELEFPLKEIKRIIESPNFDKAEALNRQIELLRLRKKHIEGLISLAEKIERNEAELMDFSAFDKTEIEKLEKEAKQKWGGTAAFAEYEQKTEGKNSMEKKDMAAALMQRFAEMGKIKHLPPDCAEAQSAVEALRGFISDNFYNCTLQILEGLGEMYAADERFTESIDAAGGEGTAAFVSHAIAAYCGK